MNSSNVLEQKPSLGEGVAANVASKRPDLLREQKPELRSHRNVRNPRQIFTRELRGIRLEFGLTKAKTVITLDWVAKYSL